MNTILHMCVFLVFVSTTVLGGRSVYRPDHSATVAGRCGFVIKISPTNSMQILALGEDTNFETHMDTYATHRSHPGSWANPFVHGYTAGLHCLLMLKLSNVGDSLEHKQFQITMEDLSIGGVPFDVGHPVEGFVFSESRRELVALNPQYLTNFLDYFISTVGTNDEVKEKVQEILQGKDAKVLIGYKTLKGELNGKDMGEYALLACIIEQSTVTT